MENSSDNRNGSLKPLEGIVLDAEGQVLHDPKISGSNSHTKFDQNFKVAWGPMRSMGIVPKTLIGMAFAAVLILGLTVAGIAIGVFIVGLIGRLLFKTKRR